MNMTDAYRLELLLELADSFPGRRTVAEIARRRGIPEAFLARLLAGLASGRLVVTVRGPRGGARLARSPDEVDLAAAMPAEPESPPGGAAVRWLAARLADGRAAVLRSLTLAELLRVEREKASVLAYEI